jgi:hypothetical protein
MVRDHARRAPTPRFSSTSLSSIDRSVFGERPLRSKDQGRSGERALREEWARPWRGQSAFHRRAPDSFEIGLLQLGGGPGLFVAQCLKESFTIECQRLCDPWVDRL